MWLERFLIIVPSLTHKQLPYSWGTYQPTPIELFIMAATFAAMVLLYTLFAKFVPIISIWEMKAGLPSRMDSAVLAEERLQSTRLDSERCPIRPDRRGGNDEGHLRSLQRSARGAAGGG